MAALNPYTVKASEVLDREIHEHIHGESAEGSPPPYSSSDREAERLKASLEKRLRHLHHHRQDPYQRQTLLCTVWQ